MENPDKTPSPEEQYEAAKIQLAIYRMIHKDEQALESAPKNQDITLWAESMLEERLKEIDHQVRSQRFRKQWRTVAMQVSKIASLIILVCTFGMGITFAASGEVRRRTLEILTAINNSYMEIKYIEEEIEVPEDWIPEYYPTYLPERYEITSYFSDGVIELHDDKGSILTVEIFDENTVITVNVEGGTIEIITLHRTEATVIHQPNGDTSIIWSIGNRFFVVDGSEENEVMKVAESMRRIKFN